MLSPHEGILNKDRSLYMYDTVDTGVNSVKCMIGLFKYAHKLYWYHQVNRSSKSRVERVICIPYGAHESIELNE